MSIIIWLVWAAAVAAAWIWPTFASVLITFIFALDVFNRILEKISVDDPARLYSVAQDYEDLP